MSVLKGLMRNICENPFDDNARLVLADYFDENGKQWHADLIRLQLRKPSFQEVYDFAKGLGTNPEPNREFGAFYFAELGWMSSPLHHSHIVSRGLIGGIHTDTNTFLRSPELVFTKNPIVHVVFQDVWPYMGSGSPQLRRTTKPKPIGSQTSSVPAVIYDRLPKGRNRFRTRQDVTRLLSRTAVDYGRERAGLPKLNWEDER